VGEKMKVYMADCTNHMLREIGDPQFTRRDVAQSYALAMRTHHDGLEVVDWAAVNAAILGRWSRYALEWIKTQAHSGKCFGVRAS
jgi:hypothetical protein